MNDPKAGITIKEPSKGKVITKAEYEKIMEKKMKEMNERMNSGRGDDGNSIEIGIGG